MTAAARARRHVRDYTLRLGDDALIAGHRLAELVTHAPQLEEDLALANIALDLLGQARALLSHAGRLEGELLGRSRDEDELAYLRSESEFRNCQLVERPNTDFAHTVARQLFFAGYLSELYRGLSESTDATLAGVAAKARNEVAYHRDHAARWTVRLGDGTEESHARMRAALEAVWPYTAELFTDDVTRGAAEAGAGTLSEPLRPAWESHIAAVLDEAGLAWPTTVRLAGPGGRGGRHGLHTESFGSLLAEMQYLRRSEPEARW